jgi:hypothetical protein
MKLPIVANGYGLDRALGALFWGAKAGETVSVMAARGRVAGRWPGCALCWLLDRIVERDHCAKALAGGDAPTARPAAYRAGVLLLLAAVGLWAAPLLAWKLLTHLI